MSADNNTMIASNKIDDIVDFFLSKSTMSHKKLQKLLYYAYSWTLALLNDSEDELCCELFVEPLEAWVHGPAVSEVYQKYKHVGWNEIPVKDNFDESIFSDDVLDILNQVWDVYGDFSANELETMTHREEPWIQARNGIPLYESSDNVLSDMVIFRFFNEQSGRTS